jgi:lysozyme
MLSNFLYERVKEKLISEEGYSEEIYKCTQGFNTVGVGHNLDANPLPMHVLKLLFENKRAVALDELFKYDIQKVIHQLDRAFPWWRKKEDNIKIFLIDFVFNVGIGTAKQFKNTMRYIEQGRYKKASKGLMNSLYARQVPNRAKRNAKLIREAKSNEIL